MSEPYQPYTPPGYQPQQPFTQTPAPPPQQVDLTPVLDLLRDVDNKLDLYVQRLAALEAKVDHMQGDLVKINDHTEHARLEERASKLEMRVQALDPKADMAHRFAAVETTMTDFKRLLYGAGGLGVLGVGGHVLNGLVGG